MSPFLKGVLDPENAVTTLVVRWGPRGTRADGRVTAEVGEQVCAVMCAVSPCPRLGIKDSETVVDWKALGTPSQYWRRGGAKQGDLPGCGPGGGGAVNLLLP